METRQRYTLGKTEKLKSRKLIEQVFKKGKSFSIFPFRVLYLETPASGFDLQTAFSVSKKYFKKATDRNRIKRLMRESWRLQKNTFATRVIETNKNILVFIIYSGNELPEFELVVEKMATVLKRLQKITDESITSNM